MSHTAEVSFSLALQNRNVGRGGVSSHPGPPAQQQIRERSHQYRELFVLFIKNLRLFSTPPLSSAGACVGVQLLSSPYRRSALAVMT